MEYFAGLLAGGWLILGSLRLLWERAGPFGSAMWRRLRAVPLATFGMILAHVGLGVFVLGAVVETHGRLSAMQSLSIGQSLPLGGYELRFQSLYQQAGKNYDAQGAVFEVVDNHGHKVCEARPQRRYYPASNDIQSKV